MRGWKPKKKILISWWTNYECSLETREVLETSSTGYSRCFYLQWKNDVLSDKPHPQFGAFNFRKKRSACVPVFTLVVFPCQDPRVSELFSSSLLSYVLSCLFVTFPGKWSPEWWNNENWIEATKGKSGEKVKLLAFFIAYKFLPYFRLIFLAVFSLVEIRDCWNTKESIVIQDRTIFRAIVHLFIKKLRYYMP